MLEEGGREAGGCCFRRALPWPGPGAPLCCRCVHRRRASPLTCLAICFLVLTYNLLGGFLFLALEGNVAGPGPGEGETAVAASKHNPSRAAGASQDGLDLRSRTVERLWSITEDLNILYKENWTKLAAKELMDFQRSLVESTQGAEPGRGGGGAGDARDRPGAGVAHRWTFSSSFLYALTLITTIGSGSVAPTSAAGRLAAVAYACVGIPIVMLYLSTVGEALARNYRVLYSRMRPGTCARNAYHAPPPLACKRFHPDRRDLYQEKRSWTPFQAALNLDSLGGGEAGLHWTCREHTRVPAALSALPVALYVALGTLLFHCTERWDPVDGCFFSFASLATIGFGDLRPGAHAAAHSAQAEDLALAACCLYILVGILVIAMCFNLIREDASPAAALCSGARAVYAAPAPAS